MFMISVRDFDEKDVKRYLSVFDCINDLYDDYGGMYYILDIDGKEKVLHRTYNIFTILSLSFDGSIDYSIFTINEDYEVIDAGFENFETHVIEGKLVVQKRETCFTECLSFSKRENGVDNDGYDGIIVYSQYDPKLDIRAVITYQQMYNGECGRIYQSHIEVPFTYALETNIVNKRHSRQHTYIKGEYRYDKSPHIFNIATIKDYGLMSFLEKGAISLQQNNKITRYYKVLAYSPQKYAITGFPFTRQYNSNEMKELFKSYGFNDSIPTYLLDLYNGEYEEMNLFKEISCVIKDIETNYSVEDIIDGKAFNLKLK